MKILQDNLNESLTYEITFFDTKMIIDEFLKHLDKISLDKIICCNNGILFRVKEGDKLGITFKLNYKDFSLSCRNDSFYLIEKKLKITDYVLVREKIMNKETSLIDNYISNISSCYLN